jgi:hypothetical protein
MLPFFEIEGADTDRDPAAGPGLPLKLRVHRIAIVCSRLDVLEGVGGQISKPFSNERRGAVGFESCWDRRINRGNGFAGDDRFSRGACRRGRGRALDQAMNRRVHASARFMGRLLVSRDDCRSRPRGVNDSPAWRRYTTITL